MSESVFLLAVSVGVHGYERLGDAYLRLLGVLTARRVARLLHKGGG